MEGVAHELAGPEYSQQERYVSLFYFELFYFFYIGHSSMQGGTPGGRYLYLKLFAAEVTSCLDD